MPLERKTRIVLLLAAAWVLGSACKTMEGEVGEPDYASDAETNLKNGREALESDNFLEAEKYFEYVRNKYPFLEASKEAELLLADTDFDRERYLEARDRYQNFVKLHPTHPKVDYAAFRSALTHYKEIPSDFFFLPPSYEKDQNEVKSAYRAMADFARNYPNSAFAPEAQKIAADARYRLAQHEWYVAEFYERREKWNAVVNRLEGLVQNFPGIGFEEKALFKLHDTYQKLKDAERAQGALRRVIEKLPGTPAAQKAQRMLGS